MSKSAETSDRPLDIVVLGHILEEKIIFPDRVLYPVLGSPAAYSSVCMGKLGAGIGLVTKIAESFPETLLKILKESDVDTKGISYCNLSTCNELIYDSNGDKKLKFLTRADPLTAEDLPANYRKAKLLYICPIDNEVKPDALEDLSNMEIPMVVDLGGYGGGTSAEHPDNKTGSFIKKLCPYFSVVKSSFEDLTHIFGPDIDEKTVGKKVLDWGGKACVITLGHKGSYVIANGKEKYYPPFPSTVEKIVDQTGAGDCFSAGMLAHYVKNGDIHEAAIFGTAATSYVIERTGGVTASRMPDIKEVNRRVSSLKELISK